MSIDRRQLLTGAAALAVSPMMPTLAMAATATLTLGDIKITPILDGTAERPLADGFVRDVPLADVQAALAKAGLPTETLRATFTPLLIESGGRKTLIDTGNGAGGAPGTGQLVANLEAAGHEPASINTVVISHFHPDHINGLRGEAGMTFANAEIAVPEVELAFWMDDGRMAAAPERMKGLFEMIRGLFGPIAGNLRRYRDGDELAAGVTAMAAHGHSPGHSVFTVASGTERMLVLSDTANTPALFVRNPDWAIQFDMDAAMARDTRRRLLDMAATERMIVSGYHFDFPARGRVEKDGTGFALVPLA